MHLSRKNITALTSAVILLLSCKHEDGMLPVTTNGGNYPAEIGNIFVTRCATAGCHNEASHTGAGGLRLDSWEHLFDGGVNGAVVVPYSSDYSSLMYFINTDSSLGPVAIPTMPLNHEPLTKEEYLAVKKWIDEGAPDKDGNIAFSSEPATRQKIYVVHLGCDMVAVIDAEKNVVMRYIPIGKTDGLEMGEYITTSPDGRYAYACMWFGEEMYKIDAYTDKVVANIPLNNILWATMTVSPDGGKVAVTNADNHQVAIVNTATASMEYLSGTSFLNPNGVAGNKTFDTFYVTSLHGNTLYKYSNGNTQTISIDGKPTTTNAGSGTPDPFEVGMSPDYTKYFVTCHQTREVRVFNTGNDSLVKVIPVGIRPTALTFAKNKPYLFVACSEDVSTGIFKGTVYVINYNTLEVVKVITGDFYQPNSVAVNEQGNTFYVFSRNQNYNGPAPHHSGPCSGRNGYYQVYDMNTLEPKNGRRYEILVDPFISASRF